MKTTIKTINELVIAEATNLKKNATVEELENLNFDKLQTDHSELCIYGQMTGVCISERAIDLIELSCERVFNDKSHNDGFDGGKMGGIKGELNGSPLGKGRGYYWSPIEIFIDMPRNKSNGNNKRLVDFLKGVTSELKLK